MAEIQIQWLGHSCFRVECQGYAIVLDPFEPGSVPGLRDIQQTADRCFAAMNTMTTTTGQGLPAGDRGGKPPRHHGLPLFPRRCGGESGANTIHLLEAQGLRVAHLGDIGACPPPMWWSASRTGRRPGAGGRLLHH